MDFLFFYFLVEGGGVFFELFLAFLAPIKGKHKFLRCCFVLKLQVFKNSTFEST